MGKRIFLFLTGVGLAFIGGFFVWLMARSYSNAKATRDWVEVPAMILQTEIKERQIGEHVPTDYAAGVLFGYEYEEKRFTSERITPRGTKWAKDKKKAEAELKGITEGEWSKCWVNPEEPTFAILKHDTKAAGYSIWFPSIICIGGLGVMLGAFRKERSEKE